MRSVPAAVPCRVAVIWIDWYPYHVARFRGLNSAPALRGGVVGIELVGGIGVHKGLKFREALPADVQVQTLLPDTSWGEASAWQLARLVWMRLTQLDPEVVLVPGYYTLPAIAAAVWARLHRRTSVLMTESTAGDHRRSWWKELPKRMTLRALFGWAVTGGKAHVQYLHQLGFPAHRILGGYDVVDNDGIARGVALARQEHRPSDVPSSPYFLYVGRLAEEKNGMRLLEAWITYRSLGGTWPLVLCGDGPERAPLQAAAASSAYGADVSLPGLKTARELYPFYAFAGCFVLPSTREPWGLVVNEAMAASLPVLVSERCGCAPDLVREGQNGFSFTPTDVQQLAKLLKGMADRSASERALLGDRSREIVSHYTPSHFGETVAAIAGNSSARSLEGRLTEVAP